MVFKLSKIRMMHISFHADIIFKKVKILITLLLITFSLQVYACDKSTLAFDEAFNTADFVFSGEITNLRYLDDVEQSRLEPRMIVTFKTERFWKGQEKAEVILHTTHNRGSCNGFVFNETEQYLVYAVLQKRANTFLTKFFAKKEPTIGVKIYGGTKLLSSAKEDVQNLNKKY